MDSADFSRALLRGRSTIAAARMEARAIPIDVAALTVLHQNWSAIKLRLVERIDADFGVYDGTTFKANRFAGWLNRNGIAWPQLSSGRPALDDETFSEMARLYPQLEPLRQLRNAMSQLRLNDLTIGKDGRNRCMLSAFRARTGRFEPSTSKFIFGTSTWLRGLIRPQPGYGLAYVDWSQQEFAIAAALSGDSAMKEAYRSGDPYLAFAKQAGAAPKDATKATHAQIRELYKACALAVQYGMEEVSLAKRIGQSRLDARELLRKHHETYKVFWRWSDAALDHALLLGYLRTVFGWTIHVGPETNPRMLRNFPMQANGAEILRLACCFPQSVGSGFAHRSTTHCSSKRLWSNLSLTLLELKMQWRRRAGLCSTDSSFVPRQRCFGIPNGSKTTVVW
jgi:DNA polymerase-1